MKIDFNVEMKDFNGKAINDQDKKAVTFKDICINALMGVLETDRTLTGNQKFELYMIAKKVHSGGVIDIGINDIKVIQDRVDKMYNCLMVGRVREIFNQCTD